MGETTYPELTWLNVAVASGFLLVNGKGLFYSCYSLTYDPLAFISTSLGLKLTKPLLIAAIRCIIQLTIMVRITGQL